ncbi:MAG: 3-oxoacyl-ACP reductase FabG [Oscillospiraceae bacterium]|nr:3-oxoacyl-ACP reductase FabG [Oscillospiraceae bacterium]
MKTALITGASGGIGSAIARKLAGDGYFVILHYHRNPDAELLAQQLHGTAIRADLENVSEIEAMIANALRQAGHVDVLINNAGISLSGLLMDISPDVRKKIFSVNILSAMECARLVLPDMIHRKSGNIINISSMWGQVGASCEVDYSATKAAMIGFTKALAQEVAPSQIRVNCVAPGVIRTGMLNCYNAETLQNLAEETPLGRLGTPEDVANVVGFLCSPASDFITGQILGVNGGFVI